MNSQVGGQKGLTLPRWLRRAKISQTKQQVDILNRPQLLQTLSGYRETRLTLVHAPAGYGKSTLLALWLNSINNDGVTTCWLSLENEDSNVRRLITYIVFSLQEGGVSFDQDGITEEQFLNDITTTDLIGVISGAIYDHEDQVILCLDDFECLAEDVIDEAIHLLIKHAPENLHIAIGTRNDSFLKISEYRTAGAVQDVNIEGLRFKVQDLKTIFNNVQLQNESQQIYTLTEGWPAVVQIIRSRVQTLQELESLSYGFSHSSTNLTAYLSEQIFDDLEPEIQQFLMDISVLDRISVDYANLIREQADSAYLFTKATLIHSLVLPLENIENTFRIHPLFRSFLYNRLQISQPERFDILHRRTARWFVRNEDLVKAVNHCVLGRRAEQATKLIEQAGGLSLWLREGNTRLKQIISLLGEHDLSHSPRVQLIKCLMLLQQGNRADAAKLFALVEKASEKVQNSRDKTISQTLKFELLIINTLLKSTDSRIHQLSFYKRLEETLNAMSSSSELAIAYLNMLQCFVLNNLGKFEKVLKVYNSTLSNNAGLKSTFVEANLRFAIGYSYFASGSTDKAEEYYEAGLTIARRKFWDEKLLKLAAISYVSELAYETNQLESIPRSCDTLASQLSNSLASFSTNAAGFIIASNVTYARTGLDSALAVLEQGLVFAQQRNMSAIVALLTMQKANLFLRNGTMDDAKQTLADADISPESYLTEASDISFWRERDKALEVLIRLALKERGGIAAIELMAIHTNPHCHVVSRLKFVVLRAIALESLGEEELASKQFEEALNIFARTKISRCIVDEKDAIQSLLNRSIEAADSSISKLAKEIKEQTLKIDAVSIPLLSNREIEVLKGLDARETNKVIARRLDISDNTVRFHLKNIFAKLNVRNREDAVDSAKQQKLI